jgi:ABC-2 type transport system permease protein
MTIMFRKALWDLRWTAVWFGLGGAGYTLLVALFFPIVKQQSQSFTNLVNSYPKGMLNALGYADLTSFTGFMGVESLNLFWPIIVAVFATLGGASVVAQEVETGTTEIWLSIPAQRWRLLLGKLGALAAGLLLAVALCVAVIVIAALIDGASVKAIGLLAMAAVMTVLLLVIAAYSSLFSSLLSSRGAAAGISFGITATCYVLYVVSGLADQWRDLKYLSIFTAYQPQKALESGSVDVAPIAILIAITAFCVGGSLALFQRRDAI